MKKIVRIGKYHKNKLWLMMTAGCFALLILSYIFPKYSYITSAYNVLEDPEEEKIYIPLKVGTQVVYEMTTPGRPLFGFQPLIVSSSGERLQGDLVLRVTTSQEKELISETRYNLSDVDVEQYVYIPLSDFNKCNGTILLTLTYEGSSTEVFPNLIANHNMQTNSKTILNGKPMKGSLLTYHVYQKASYPLVYDLQILTLLFACVTVVAGINKNDKKQEQKYNKEET